MTPIGRLSKKNLAVDPLVPDIYYKAVVAEIKT